MGSSTFFRAALAAGAIVAATNAAQAGTVTDAYLDLDGAYNLSKGHLSFSGTATGMVSGDPTAERAYNLDITAGLKVDPFGFPVFKLDETIESDALTQIPGLDTDGNGAFSLLDAYNVADSLLGEFGFDDELSDLFDDIELGKKYSKDFSFKFERHDVARVFCGKFGAPIPMQTATYDGGKQGGDCLPHSMKGDFDFGLALTYDKTAGETPAPIPLPASLPLLAAGIGGIGVLRRFRKARA